MPAHQQLHSSTASSVIPVMLVMLAMLIYLVAGVWQNQFRSKWSAWYTVSFLGGSLLLIIGLHPAMVIFAHQNFRGHIIQHLLIGMLAPLGLVFGAPVTLALRLLPVKFSRTITGILASRLFQFISHPVSALLLNIGGMYLLYLTPLYNTMLTSPYLHQVVHFHFLAAGYLFTWAIAGPDPAPHRPGIPIRLLVLFISMAAHAYLSKFMYAYNWPLNSPHTVEQIRLGAKLMYYGGDFAELLLLIALFITWYRKRGYSTANLRAQPL